MLRRIALACALAYSAGAAGAATSPLTLQVYNPGAHSVFPVSSEIISGQHDAVLVDAQFQRNDAEAVVKMIKATGKNLTLVYVSHSDPDYYFGLNVIKTAFPNAKIVATAPSVAAIKVLMQRKLAYWGPILKQNAPHKLVLPDVLQGNRIMLEGRALDIEGLDGPTPDRSYVWIPSLRTVVGGAVVFGGTHVWVADTQTPLARKQWLATLKSVEALKPLRVVPGHYLGPLQPGLVAVKFDEEYLKNFEIQNQKAQTAQALVTAMESLYPNLPERSWLELGAKVIKGDYKWPQ